MLQLLILTRLVPLRRLFHVLSQKNYFILLFQRDFGTWVDTLVLQETDDEQHFTGFVHMKGPVHVFGDFRSDWFNGINVSRLPEVLVDKTAHQIIAGNSNSNFLNRVFHLFCVNFKVLYSLLVRYSWQTRQLILSMAS